MSELSRGESRVRTSFNPSNTSIVDQIKQKSAELINLVDDMPAKSSLADKELGEFVRVKALAMTAYEEAAMWAVKAATF